MALRSLTPELFEFLRAMTVPCVISTLRPDGGPITSATWYGVVDEQIVVSTPGERTKANNVRRDPRVSFIVDTKERPYRGVAIEGRADVVDDPEGTYLRAIIERYLGPTPSDEVRRRMESRGTRVILRIRPQRVRPWGFG